MKERVEPLCRPKVPDDLGRIEPQPAVRRASEEEPEDKQGTYPDEVDLGESCPLRLTKAGTRRPHLKSVSRQGTAGPGKAKTHLFIRYQIVLRILANGVIPIPLEDENIGVRVRTSVVSRSGWTYAPTSKIVSNLLKSSEALPNGLEVEVPPLVSFRSKNKRSLAKGDGGRKGGGSSPVDHDPRQVLVQRQLDHLPFAPSQLSLLGRSSNRRLPLRFLVVPRRPARM